MKWNVTSVAPQSGQAAGDWRPNWRGSVQHIGAEFEVGYMFQHTLNAQCPPAKTDGFNFLNKESSIQTRPKTETRTLDLRNREFLWSGLLG